MQGHNLILSVRDKGPERLKGSGKPRLERTWSRFYDIDLCQVCMDGIEIPKACIEQ